MWLKKNAHSGNKYVGPILKTDYSEQNCTAQIVNWLECIWSSNPVTYLDQET